MSVHLTSAQAARTAGVSRWTITRAIKTGELRAIRNNKGLWLIAPEDLSAWRSAPTAPTAQGAHLVQHAPSAPGIAPNAPAAPQDAPADNVLRAELESLRVKLEAAEVALEAERERTNQERARANRERELVDDLRTRLTRAEEERRAVVEQITAMVAKITEPEPAPAPRRGFLARLLGT